MTILKAIFQIEELIINICNTIIESKDIPEMRQALDLLYEAKWNIEEARKILKDVNQTLRH